ncbi:MAG: hypothetical protein JOY66_05570 [Acetobacteraceae bacterium]|nr:hypothetical protein [Acetobacteraceae bacterium]
MRPLPPGKYGVIHEVEVKGHELDALAKKLGIEKPSRLREGKIHIVREYGPGEEPPRGKG